MRSVDLLWSMHPIHPSLNSLRIFTLMVRHFPSICFKPAPVVLDDRPLDAQVRTALYSLHQVRETVMDVLVMHLLLHLPARFFLRACGNAVDELPVELANHALVGRLARGCTDGISRRVSTSYQAMELVIH